MRFVEQLKDPQASVRNEALQGIEPYGGSAGFAAPGVEKLLKDEDGTVREEADSVLSAIR